LGQKQRRRKARRLESQPVVRSREAAPTREGPFILPPTQVIGLSLVLSLLVAIVYAQVRHFGFVYLDDPVYVAENSWVLKGLSLAGVKWSLTTQAAGNWHPLTWISHMIDVDAYGVKPGGHHVTSAVIHLANTVLLFLAFARMTSRVWESALVAALFAIHPLHVESVAWISERKDVLSALFWILTIHAYISYARHRSVARYLLVLLLFALGLMSKPMVVTLPFTLLLLDYWPLRRLASTSVNQVSAWLTLAKEKIPLFVLMVASMIVTMKVQAGYGAVVTLDHLRFTTRVANSIVAYVAYIRDMLWPSGLAAYYPFRPHSAAYIATSAVLLIAVTVFALMQSRRRPYLLFGWAWFIGTLIPAIGLVQVGDQARADRYTYVPAIGLFVIAVWWVSEVVPQGRYRKFALAPAALVVGALTVVAVRQANYWRNNLSLFTRAVAVTDRNYRAEALLGVALSASEKHDEAIMHYRTSLSIWPGNAEVHSNLGASLFARGKIDEALNEFYEAVRYKPQAALYHYNLGVMLNEKGRVREGLEEVKAAVQLEPGNKQYQKALSIILGRQNPQT
jgi:protein O-mannosyl-transferase